MPQRQPPDPAKLRKLQEALEAYEAGETAPLIDEERDKALTALRERALRLLDQRSRSRHELRERLLAPPRGKAGKAGKGTGGRADEGAVQEIDAELVDEVLDSLQRSGLINDEVFAREWVRQRFNGRGKSAKMLDIELQRKGVAEADRVEALDQIDEDDERELAYELARKKARSVKAIPADRAERDKQLRRIVGVLARRGFNQGMALSIARDVLDQRCEELESN